jgi:hypothetical protein
MSRTQVYRGHTYFHNEHQCNTSVKDVGSLVLCLLKCIAHTFENANFRFQCQPADPIIVGISCRHMNSSHTQNAVQKYAW